MTYTPLKKGNAPLVISSILFLCTAVSLIFFALNIGNRMIMQLIMVLSAAEALSIVSRYILSGFVYTLNIDTDFDKSPDFKITKTHGTRKKTVCNLSLQTAVGIVPKAPLKEIEQKYGRISKRYNYCVNMFPDESYIYIFEFNGGINLIEIELNSDFYLYFKYMIGQQ